MLEQLHIENAAVIERADLTFGRGLNVLTGETGAGKSIIIDAVGAILGDRVSREIVRTGAAAARFTAELTPTAAACAWLTENELEFQSGECILVSRRITAEGKSSCRVNGVPVTAAQLRAFGDVLFDVHGQNDGRRLLSEASHRAALDAFGAYPELSEAYVAEYREYAGLRSRLEELRRSEEDKEFLEARLKKEIRELSAAAPKDGEAEALEQRVRRLRHAERLTDALTEAYEDLRGGERAEGAADLLAAAASAVNAAARVDESYGPLGSDIEDLRYRAEDLAERLEDARRELDYSPGELDRLEGRLSVLQRLLRRYGSEAAARERLEKARCELEDVQYLDEHLAKLEAALEKKETALLAAGERLSGARQKAAEKLEKAVERELRELSMPGARFRVSLSPKSGEGFDSAGLEDVRFLLSANPGQDPGRLSHIASGGELSRIMLALKNVLRSNSDPEVLIFDEIDTGVSGVAAQRVGEKLASLASERQVLCVTHLPQLAAMADVQFSIVKKQTGDGTFTEVNRLDAGGRRRELARLIGGETVTENTLSGASELIEAAEGFKAKLRERG
ncbi:MAG: DNA repair protein RecN [Oscillospiraceae bacterium]|nr:DNA repair protein RecN [Oscillospiraceae bacterium]